MTLILWHDITLAYRISSNRSHRLLLETRLVLETRLLLEPPGSPKNMTLLKKQRFLVLYLLLQSEIPGRPYRRSPNHAIRTNDAMHHRATWGCAISSMILAFRPPASVRDPACIRDPASIRTNEVWTPASIRDPACIWDPASIRGNTVYCL